MTFCGQPDRQKECLSDCLCFARIKGVTKDTLFHYDEIGVFSPALKADNGYRYYYIWQLEAFQAITALRKLGMTL